VSRYRVEFITTGPDDESMMRAKPLSETLKENGVAAGSLKIEKTYDALDFNRPVDPRWRMILDYIKDLEAKGWRMRSRHAAIKDGEVMSCFYKANHRERPDDGTYDVFYITVSPSPFIRSKGQLELKVERMIGYSREYWEEQLNRGPDSSLPIIDENWVHRSIAKDLTSNQDFAGHGGHEFKFKITDPKLVAEAKRRGLKVEYNSVEGDHEFKESYYYIVSRNVWHQGIIPPPMRSYFTQNVQTRW
jgi:hypothetical protein